MIPAGARALSLSPRLHCRRNIEMVIAEEPRWRRTWPWLLALVAAIPWLLAPTLPLLLIVAAGWYLRRVQLRRRRSSISIHDGEIVIVNRFSTHRVPISGASIEVSNETFGPLTGDEELDDEMARMAGAALYVVPREGVTRKIPVDAALGLLPRDFRRVAMELETAVAISG